MTKKWELQVERDGEQVRAHRRRTVGAYQVFHRDVAVEGLNGSCAEPRGPADNSHAKNNRCIEPGTYPLATHIGPKYCTIGYNNPNPTNRRKPALRLLRAGKRDAVLLHPARGFLSSTGCINVSKPLKNADSDLDFIDSKKRVIAIIDNLKSYLGDGFPNKNGIAIPGASMVIR